MVLRLGAQRGRRLDEALEADVDLALGLSVHGGARQALGVGEEAEAALSAAAAVLEAGRVEPRPIPERLIGRAIAVVVDQVAALEGGRGRGADLADPLDAQQLTGARADGVVVLAHAERHVVVDEAVAVVVCAIAELGRRGRRVARAELSVRQTDLLPEAHAVLAGLGAGDGVADRG